MLQKIVCVASLVLLSLSCMHRRPGSHVYEGPPEESAILEEVLRIAIADARENALPFEVAFLKLQHGNDPSPELLQRFSTETGLYLQPVSASKEVEIAAPINDFQYCERSDRFCRKRGIVIYASVEEMVDADTAKVGFGWSQYSMAMAGVAGTLKRVDGKWVLLEEGQIRLMS